MTWPNPAISCVNDGSQWGADGSFSLSAIIHAFQASVTLLQLPEMKCLIEKWSGAAWGWQVIQRVPLKYFHSHAKRVHKVKEEGL